MKKLTPLFYSALSAILASSASATVLAYEGFATDATGSGVNYVDGAIMATNGTAPNFDGVDKPRTGYTGGWGPVGTSNLSPNVNTVTITGNLTYSGYDTGTDGMANPYRTTGAAPGNKWVARALTIANDGSYDSGYYVSALVDFNDSSGGGFGWTVGGSRSNSLEYNGTNATFTSAGNSGETYSFVPSAGTNLIIIQYTTTTSGSFSSNFYTQWNLWVNPDLSGGDLGTVTASGFGIGLLNNGAITNFTNAFTSASNLANGESMFVDEMYITNDFNDFVVVPEPQSFALIACLTSLGIVMMRRSRRA